MGRLYAVSFQATQTPAHFAVVAAMAGHPWALREAMTLLDIGCGRGHAVHVLAAANPGWTVFGLDHDAAAIAEARALAAEAGLANAIFLESDLAALDPGEFARLPPFDVVMAHGVWSWVGDAARAGVVRILAERLKPGGLAYLGTNALPVAGREAALQRLLWHLAEGGTDAAAAERAVARLRVLMQGEGLPLPGTPMLERILAGLEPGFVAQEFLTPHWRPCFHGELLDALAPAKLDFLGPCDLADWIEPLYATEGLTAGLAELGPGPGGELLRDLALGRAFRADLFVRGRRRVEPAGRLGALAVMAVTAPPETSPVLRAGGARAGLAPASWAPIRAALAEGPVTLGALAALDRSRVGPGLAELAALLLGTGLAVPVFREARPAPASQRYHRVMARHFGEAGGHYALASPVAAGGVPAEALDLALVAGALAGKAFEGPAAARFAEREAAWRRLGILPE